MIDGRARCLGLLLALLAEWIPAAAGAEAGVQVTSDGHTIDVEVAAVPLADVLRAVADAAGLRLKVRGELGEAEPQSLDRVPLEEAIRRLVGNNPVNLVLSYATDRDGRRRLVGLVAQQASAVSPEQREQQRMRLSLGRIEVPPPPPPPPGLSTSKQ